MIKTLFMMSPHRPWSDIREQALADLPPAERAAREVHIATIFAEMGEAISAYRASCLHPGREPLWPDTPDDLHCSECGIHLIPTGACAVLSP